MNERKLSPNSLAKKPEIERELDAQAVKIKELRTKISTLLERISDILRPITPRGQNPAEKEALLTPMARKLEENTSDIANAIDDIDSILDRCEL